MDESGYANCLARADGRDSRRLRVGRPLRCITLVLATTTITAGPIKSKKSITHVVSGSPHDADLSIRLYSLHRRPIASVSVRVQSSSLDVSGPIQSSWVYETSTGFLTSQNLFGIPSSFERGTDGNLSASLDALSHRTTYTYSWGVMDTITPPSATGNPGTHITRGINSDGTVASVANDLDLPTLFTYDDLGRETSAHQTGFNGSGVEYDLVNNRFVRVSAGHFKGKRRGRNTRWMVSDGRSEASTS